MEQKTTEKTVKTILRLIERDLETFEEGGGEYLICNHAEGIGMVLPFDWTEAWCPDLKVPFEYFIAHQTVCMEGVYVWDVSRFLCSKLREFNDKS